MFGKTSYNYYKKTVILQFLRQGKANG